MTNKSRPKAGRLASWLVIMTGLVATGAERCESPKLETRPGPCLCVSGPLGTTSQIQFADALDAPEAWPVLTNVVLHTSPIELTDPQAAGVPQRFCRMRGCPVILAEPEDRVALAGGTVSLTVLAELSCLPVTYE